jgi:hypothetical protein
MPLKGVRAPAMDLPGPEPHRAAATTLSAVPRRLRALVILCVLSLAALTFVETLPAGGPVDVLLGTLIWVPA